MVVERVVVTTKHNDDDQYAWESHVGGSFTIRNDVKGEPLGRGTKVTLFLEEDQLDFSKEKKLNELVKKHSEFISYPIYLWTEKKTVEKEISDDEGEDGEAVEKKEEEGKVEKVDEDKDKEGKPKKKVKKVRHK